MNKTCRTRAVALAMALVAVGAGACSDSSDYEYVAPASVEDAGGGLSRVILTAGGAERTGIETTPVTTETVDGDERLVIPYSAVMYHFDGTTWTYGEDDLSYTRMPIEIERIDGDRAVLVSGPSAGTSVVTVGAAELYGVEFGIGK